MHVGTRVNISRVICAHEQLKGLRTGSAVPRRRAPRVPYSRRVLIKFHTRTDPPLHTQNNMHMVFCVVRVQCVGIAGRGRDVCIAHDRQTKETDRRSAYDLWLKGTPPHGNIGTKIHVCKSAQIGTFVCSACESCEQR